MSKAPLVFTFYIAAPIEKVWDGFVSREANQSVLDVIDSGKRKSALFTTYALSLSFLESILLRSLRRAGCQETRVITDLQGYRDSLSQCC